MAPDDAADMQILTDEQKKKLAEMRPRGPGPGGPDGRGPGSRGPGGPPKKDE